LNLGNSNVPAALIVHDYVTSSNASFKKTSLLHCVQEPAISGNTAIIIRNTEGYNGKLISTSLLPVNAVLTKVGGVGNEFSVGGVNFPQSIGNSNNSWDGAIWRVEISPSTAAATDTFLNVMQVMDAAYNSPLTVTAIDTTNYTGAQIGDRIVLFSKTGNVLNSSISLTFSGVGTFKVLITDVENGNWSVSGGVGTVVSANNNIYFSATAGTYTITKN